MYFLVGVMENQGSFKLMLIMKMVLYIIECFIQKADTSRYMLAKGKKKNISLNKNI